MIPPGSSAGKRALYTLFGHVSSSLGNLPLHETDCTENHAQGTEHVQTVNTTLFSQPAQYHKSLETRVPISTGCNL